MIHSGNGGRPSFVRIVLPNGEEVTGWSEAARRLNADRNALRRRSERRGDVFYIRGLKKRGRPRKVTS